MANVPKHKDALIQAAIRLFREKGYASSGLSEILSLSGAPKGSLYHYFPNGKEELAAAALTTAAAVVAKTLNNLAEETHSPGEFVQRYCEMLAGWMENSGYKSGCPITTTVLETVPQSTILSAVSRHAIASWVNIIAAFYQRNGLARPDAEEQAEFVISAIRGALIQCRIQQSPAPLLNVARRINSMNLSQN